MKIEIFFSNKKVALVATFILIFFGLVLLICWPPLLKYEKMSIELAKINSQGRWIELEGEVLSITPKTSGTSISLCSTQEKCITTYFSGHKELTYLKGSQLRIRGEISQIGTNRFLSGHEFEVIR